MSNLALPAGITADDLAALLAMLPRAIPWGQFRAEVWPGFAPPLATKKHSKKVDQVLRELEALDPPPATTADLTVSLVARYVATRPPAWSPYTLHGHLQIVRTLCGIAVRHRYLLVSPFALRPLHQLAPLPAVPPGKRHLTLDECHRLLDKLAQAVATKAGWPLWRARRDQAVIATALYTGLRAGECLRLQVQDLDLDARIIRLVPRGKGQRLKTTASAQPVGLPLAAVMVLRSWLPHRLEVPADRRQPVPDDCPWLWPCVVQRNKPWTGGCTGGKPVDRLQAAGRRAGIDHVDFPTLRRTLATHMEALGVAPGMIQRTLRHTRPETTTTHYRRADEANIAAAVRDITF
jgi:integrase